MTPLNVWMILRLDAISAILWFIPGVVLFALLCSGSFWCDEDFCSAKTRNSIFAWCGSISLVCLLLAALTPTSKQAAAIFILPRVANSSVITNDVPELYGMAFDLLREKMAQATEGVER